MHAGYLFLGYLALILVGAKAGSELFSRIRVSPVLGEIFVGFLLGPFCFGLIDLKGFQEAGAAVHFQSELGVLFMMFYIGLETRLSQILEVGFLAVAVALGGVFLPLVLGYYVGVWMYPQEGWQTHLFIGAVMSATSVAITARVIMDMGLSRSRLSRTILAAAVLDDILGLMVLSVSLAVTGSSSGGAAHGSVPAGVALAATVFGLEGSILPTLLAMAVFLLGLFPLLWLLLPRLLRAVGKLEGKGSLLVVTVGLMLLFTYAASLCSLAPIVGAFLFGMLVGASGNRAAVEEGVEPLYLVLAPVFFVTIGIGFDVRSIAAAWQFTVILTLAAVISKVVGCGLCARLGKATWAESSFIGLGMVPRGEVGLIVANAGFAAGVLQQSVFTGAVAMSILTVLIAPPFLRVLGRRIQARVNTEESAGTG